MATPNIFPFKLHSSAATPIYRKWRTDNREMLNRDHGTIYFAGSCITAESCERDGTIYCGYGNYQAWSCYEYDVFALSPTEIEIKAYGMEDPVYGGRGNLQNTFKATVEADVLAEAVKRERMEYAVYEYRERLAKAEAEVFRREVAKVYAELFGEAA